jgi:hypothetical protein
MPKDVLGADAELRVRLRLEALSAPFAVALPPPRLVPPKIHLITNGADGAVDVYAEGPKSKVRLLTEGLDEGVTREELMIRVGGWEAHPAEIEYVPSNGLHYVNVFLLAGTRRGETRAQVRYRGLWSDAVPLRIL